MGRKRESKAKRRHMERTKRDLPANTNSKSPLIPTPALDNGHLAAQVASRSIEDLMAVTVLLGVEAALGVEVVGVAVMAVTAVAVVVGVCVGHLCCCSCLTSLLWIYTKKEAREEREKMEEKEEMVQERVRRKKKSHNTKNPKNRSHAPSMPLNGNSR